MIQVSATTIEPGIYRGMSFEEYCAIDAVNQSLLKQMTRSAAHFRAAETDPDFIDTPATRFGSFYHMGILEPREVPRHYAVMPAFHLDERNVTKAGDQSDSKTTTFYKEQKAAFVKANPGREIVDQAAYDKLIGMAAAMERHPEASRLFSRGGGSEVVIVADDPATGIRCKCRSDSLVEDDWPTIADLKSTENADVISHNGVRGFSYSIDARGYDMQAAFNVDLYKQATGKDANFIVIAQEKRPPFEIRTWDLTDKIGGHSWVDVGRKKYVGLLMALKKCRDEDTYPGYDTEIICDGPPRRVLEREGLA